MYCISVDKMAAHNLNNVGVFFYAFPSYLLKTDAGRCQNT